jgi:hypothetical protein
LLLLLPLPAFALSFGNNTWSVQDNTGKGFFSIGPGTDPSHLDIQMAATNSGNVRGTVVFTSLAGAITGNLGVDQIKTTISNFIPQIDIKGQAQPRICPSAQGRDNERALDKRLVVCGDSRLGTRFDKLIGEDSTMGDVPTSGLAYPQRLVLADFPDGAVLLDLQTGSFFRVNAAAARVFVSLIDGASETDAANALARSCGITPEAAARDVATLLARLPTSGETKASNPIVFRQNADSLMLECNGQLLWQISHEGRELTYLANSPVGAPEPMTQLLWVAPHVLLLRGIVVLHASAVQEAAGVLAFCGGSGQGKTTLARALAATGRNLIAEDLLIVRFTAGRPEAIAGGEAAIRSWADREARQLSCGRRIATDDLVRAADGPPLPFAAILFPRRDARETRITHTPLGCAEALVHLLENSFAEASRRDLWQRLWDAHRLLAQRVPAHIAHVAEGLEVLQQAAACYSLTVKS